MKLGELLFMLRQGDPNRDVIFRGENGALIVPIAISLSLNGDTIVDLDEDIFDMNAHCSNFIALDPLNDQAYERRNTPRDDEPPKGNPK